jgi:hypothetical protein
LFTLGSKEGGWGSVRCGGSGAGKARWNSVATGGKAVLELRWFRIRKMLCRSAEVGVAGSGCGRVGNRKISSRLIGTGFRDRKFRGRWGQNLRFRVRKVGLMFGESLVDGFATLGIVVIEDDGLYGGVDVGNIGLLYNRLWCPLPRD